jgi:hypothetical protein
MTLLQTVPMPERIAALPKNHAGYPVPWFVAWIDDKPDFRVMDIDRLRDAIHFGKCWICGETLGRNHSYVVGPMCAVNLISAEPPSHTECAEYSAKVCPFLTIPKKTRREGRMPEGGLTSAGVMISRNPGVALVWTTRQKIRPFTPPGGGVLFQLPPALEVSWWAEGREATRAEVEESVRTGLPALYEVEDDPRAHKEIDRRLDLARELFPA